MSFLRSLSLFFVGLLACAPLHAQSVVLDRQPASQPANIRDISPLGPPPRPVFFPTIHLPMPVVPTVGLRMEMSFAPPIKDVPTDPYQMGKYGRLSMDYTRVGRFDGGDFGVMVQALHVAHHLLFYSAGFTEDINNDGKFLLTAGIAHYQTGNAPTEPFVEAPFVRLRMQSLSEERMVSRNEETDWFLYGEAETTMHYREYLSGVVGLGLRLSPMLRMIGGFQHTEFVMPTERVVRMVDGLQGILQWGM